MSTANSLWDQLASTDAYESRSWSPAVKDDAIVGVIRSYGYVQTKHGEKLRMVVDAEKMTMNGEMALPGIVSVWERARLKQAWLELKPCEGDQIGIRYVGVGEAKNGNPPKRFAVKIVPTGASKPYVAPVPSDVGDIEQPQATEDNAGENDRVPF